MQFFILIFFSMQIFLLERKLKENLEWLLQILVMCLNSASVHLFKQAQGGIKINNGF